MTVEGNDIICNCRACFQEGFGIALEEQNGVYVCPQNPEHRYVVKNGFMATSHTRTF
ncbi:hypothetical protein HY572_02115 [Candidatus Micrarchaeota archaeon]|nr:hypothetical protein [Candidatus Micrarchaeota archaeon]